MSPRTLDPRRLALDGSALIEASAGTGKTYTIVGLYLRLLLEAGLDLDRILVVTFTNAATEELRGRIRRRITEAIGALASGAAADPLLTGILAGLPDPAVARRHLADTLARLDEAAVYTIHGFCQRMLQDNALESQVAFDAEFVTDESALRRTVIADFWRRRTRSMDSLEARWLRGQWRTPLALLDALGPMARDDRIKVLPQPADLAAAGDLAGLAGIFAALTEAWARDREQVVDILENSPALNRRSYNTKVVRHAVAAMDEILGGELPLVLPKEFHRFTPVLLQEQTKPGQAVPHHAFFDRCGIFAQTLDAVLRAAQVRLLAAARQYLTGEMARRKEQRQVLFFDDLLRRLDGALGNDGGCGLAAAIRSRFPVALIDEFQDTDPLQYRIFRRIYGPVSGGGLFLIGDPKQAIYSFRGADIFTYMRARDDAGDARTYTLGTNWRSAADLVSAVNHLFSQAERPFVYDAHIPFSPVGAGPRADIPPLTLDGRVPPPLCFWFLSSNNLSTTRDGAITADAARDAAAAVCAEQIAGLLALAGQGRANLGDAALQAGDIAVLVRSHQDGTRMQEALRTRRVASVSLGQQSVFATAQAAALERLLLAVAAPGNEGRLRAALSTDLMGWCADEILALDSRENDREAVQARFRGYRNLWRQRGFQTAFFTFIDGEGVCARLRRAPDGERRLTNLMHLGELLQDAARQSTGTERLLRWLADQRSGAQSGDDQLLRLESDEALVKIVTIHKSKGLEYPVVFIPFPWVGSLQNRGPVLFHDPRPPYSACLDLGSEAIDAHRQLAAAEELAERLRLLYVAVTRARHLCVLTWGRINNAHTSALAWLLHPDKGSDPPASVMADLDEDTILARLQTLARGSGGTIQVAVPAAAPAAMPVVPVAAAPTLAARKFSGHIPRDWRMTSYSGLLAGVDAERPDYDPQPPADATAETAAPADSVFGFPRGTGPGQCLHELFEHLDFPAAGGPDLNAAIDGQLARYAIDSRWRPTVADIVGRVLDTALDGDGLCLRGIDRRDRLDEMEFHYPLARLDPAGLAAALAGFGAYRSAADRLAFDPVRGLMKGFIDLVFRHQGRFYIVDYKSNHLGERFENYGQADLKAAMAAHHYDLQYLVYTVAVHRYLRNRLAGYVYDRHFGGVYYLFLRGMHPARGPSCGVFYDRPAPALVQALDMLFDGQEGKWNRAPLKRLSV